MCTFSYGMNAIQHEVTTGRYGTNMDFQQHFVVIVRDEFTWITELRQKINVDEVIENSMFKEREHAKEEQ